MITIDIAKAAVVILLAWHMIGAGIALAEWVSVPSSRGLSFMDWIFRLILVMAIGQRVFGLW